MQSTLQHAVYRTLLATAVVVGTSSTLNQAFAAPTPTPQPSSLIRLLTSTTLSSMLRLQGLGSHGTCNRNTTFGHALTYIIPDRHLTSRRWEGEGSEVHTVGSSATF